MKLWTFSTSNDARPWRQIISYPIYSFSEQLVFDICKGKESRSGRLFKEKVNISSENVRGRLNRVQKKKQLFTEFGGISVEELNKHL